MPEICTCGAELPPDARFCHKCGRPQRVEMELEVEEPKFAPVASEAAFAPPVLEPPVPPALDFHNPVAVRVGFFAASLAALLSWIPLVNLGFFIWWLSGGFLAVYLYRRRTGQFLTVGSGLRLGWITGILTFVIMTAMFTVTIVPVALNAGGMGALFEQQMRHMPAGDPNVQEALRMFQSPGGVATILSFMLVMFFALITLLATVGGALGARIVGREN
ncbi:MAG TPA: zinc ribbon domain-containing protein [Bryobacteraceae bacterium]|nr:zinc ribbon domain-containing protein [Bryobacteraceae bacterium]